MDCTQDEIVQDRRCKMCGASKATKARPEGLAHLEMPPPTQRKKGLTLHDPDGVLIVEFRLRILQRHSRNIREISFVA